MTVPMRKWRWLNLKKRELFDGWGAIPTFSKRRETAVCARWATHTDDESPGKVAERQKGREKMEFGKVLKEQALKRFETTPQLSSMTDLIGIVLGSTRTRSTMALAEEVNTYMSVDPGCMDGINWMDLMSIDGMTKAKAVQVCAAIELGRRLACQCNKREMPDFSFPDSVARFFMERLRHETQEHFLVAFVNVKNRLLGYKEIGVGNMSAAPVDIKEAMKWAIRYKAAGLILVHNHPSGDPEPSANDLQVTTSFAAAAKLLDTEVLDHIIIGDGVFVSLHERGVC